MQSITMTSPRSSSLFPPLTARLIATALMAGLAADLTWEVWARVLTPLVPGVGGPLEPAALVQSVFGLESRLAGEIIHFVVGVAFYPIGYLFVARPLQRLIIPALPWFVTALGFGAGLFVFALYIMLLGALREARILFRAPEQSITVDLKNAPTLLSR